MPLVKMEKSEEGPEVFGLKFQMDLWLLLSMGMEIEDYISDQILELGWKFGIQLCKAVAFQHVSKRR